MARGPVPQLDPLPYRTPISLATPIAMVSAATNTVLIRRRHNNAYNTSLPLQHDTWKAVRAIMNIINDNATATRTLAEKEETRIYTHYEGWLPADEDLPTNKWRDAWTSSAGLLRDTHPRTTSPRKNVACIWFMVNDADGCQSSPLARIIANPI